ncbi:MAG TPA: hypothetical protein VLI41_06675 [Phenylobacterium sp.]|uniref:hypothetical protein n=1 Tax=Phenylobacterium sp. TaxID=1871053 RepID=UPI002C8A679C|nr:hypothetical protein [Phenylobacterium sp.]HSV02874.1 hypothetical protein [Phenylobacterium sp.]
MSAFQAYGGSYEYNGRAFSWRCYATTRVYEVRISDHVPHGSAPNGKSWIHRSRHKGDAEFAWLVDAGAERFSHILLQVDALGRADERREEARPEAVAY